MKKKSRFSTSIFPFRLLRQTAAVVNPVRPSEVVDNADSWSSFTALDRVIVTVADGDDNNYDTLVINVINCQIEFT